MFASTDFAKDIGKGRPGELIFKQDFLDFLGIKYVDVTTCQQFQVIDTDYLTKIGTYEIKNNYKDNRIIIIEEYTNVNEALGKISYGWFYKTSADLIIFISQKTRTMVFLPFTSPFKARYESIKNDFKLCWNKISVNNGKKWQSAFRPVPLGALSGYYSMYKKISD